MYGFALDELYFQIPSRVVIKVKCDLEVLFFKVMFLLITFSYVSLYGLF